MRNYLMFGLFVLSFIFSTNITAEVEEYGTASYYSDKFQGRKTASGELYDKNKFTGAHKSLKFGTIILVTRLDNKKSVKIRINDRGPYIKGRIVDVSRVAAEKLDLIRDGHAEVKIEIVDEDKPEFAVATPPPTANNQPDLSAMKDKESTNIVEDPTPSSFSDNSVIQPIAPTTVATPKEVKKAIPDLTVPSKKAPAAKSVASEAVYTKVRGSDYKQYDLYKIQLVRPARKGFGVQVASLRKFENVMKQVAELQEKWFNNILISVEKGADDNTIYKLILGPFPDRATAESYKKELRNNKKMDGFVVDLSVNK